MIITAKVTEILTGLLLVVAVRTTFITIVLLGHIYNYRDSNIEEYNDFYF